MARGLCERSPFALRFVSGCAPRFGNLGERYRGGLGHFAYGTMHSVMAGLDEDVIRHALQTARAHGFRSVSLKLGKDEFSATLSPVAVVESASPPPALVESAGEPTPAGDVVRVIPSPCVGYFRLVEGIGQPGDRIEEGSVVAMISALGMDTEVVSPCGGEVSQVLVADGDAVQYGQPLMEVTV